MWEFKMHMTEAWSAKKLFSDSVILDLYMLNYKHNSSKSMLRDSSSLPRVAQQNS